MRQLVGSRADKRGAASASAMGRFETATLTRPENLASLADLPDRWIDAVHDRRPPKSITLDIGGGAPGRRRDRAPCSARRPLARFADSASANRRAARRCFWLARHLEWRRSHRRRRKWRIPD
jgi:hypothetical protein